MPVVSNGSLFKIVDNQMIGSDVIINRYWYFLNAIPNSVSASDIADLWEAIFSAWLPPAQVTALTHTTIEVDEVTSVSNFFTRASTLGAGTRVGPVLPYYVAARIRLFRTTKETRSGWKRIGVATETDLETNGWSPTYKAVLDSLAAVMNDPLITTAGNAEPCIVRITKDPATGAPFAPSLWVYNLVESAGASSFNTTQNTRKTGRGV